MRFIQFLILFFISTLLCNAQNIKHISVNEGLPQSFVSDLLEDHNGFIWISTRNGLARYEGHKLEILQHVPGEVNSLASNIISKLQKGEGNTIWIQYETDELDLLDLNTGKITHIPGVENYYQTGNGYIDKKSKLWYYYENNVYSLNLNATDKALDKKTYTPDEDKISNIFIDRSNNIWVLGLKGINKFNTSLNKFELIVNPYASNSIENEPATNLFERDNGEFMWLGEEYLNFFDPKNNSFKRLPLPKHETKGFKQIQTNSNGEDYIIINRNIYTYEDVKGITLLGQLPFDDDNIKKKPLFYDFLVDQSGLIWLAANTDGVYQVDFSLNFKDFSYEDDFAMTLFKNQFNISLEDYFNFNTSNKLLLLPSYYLRSVKYNDKIWVALHRTVAYYKPGGNKLSKLKNLPVPTIDDFVPIKGITINRNGNPLVIDESCNIFSYNDNEQQWYLEPYSKLLKASFKNKLSPSSILLDDNYIWITTEYSGLIRIDTKTSKISQFKAENTTNGLPTNNLISIISDSKEKNILWIASYYGLLKFNKNTFKNKLFTIEDGLPDNTIYTLLEDNKGFLWLGTNKGLCRFNSKTLNHRTFSSSHGLTALEYNRYHQFIMPNGDFAFGGINGGTIFNPLSISDDKFNPSVVITQIKINNESYLKEGDNFLIYSDLKTLDLPHFKNNLIIEFSALEFSQSDDIKYRYRLKGYDDEWVVLKGKNEAVYTKIPFGDYTLEVNATNTSGVWSTDIETLDINISPAWWETTWAIFLYIMAFSAIIFLFIKRSIKQKVINKEIELKRKEADHFREINNLKTRFFTNLTHELRTPLSLIIAPVEQLKKTKKKKNRKRLLSIIKKNANNLLNLSDQLLDISKIEAGVLEANYFPGDMVLSIKKSIEAFKEEAKEKIITIDLISPLTANYIFSPYLLERIINNLISNSIKYGKRGGKILLSLSEEKDGVIVKIEDDGIGISKKDLPHIFERFYQSENSKNNQNIVTGSGIGLSLVNELVQMQNGKINVESSIGDDSGTIFKIYLPYKKVESLAKLPKVKNEELVSATLIKDDESPTILLVEDNEEMLDFLSISLKPHYNIIKSDNAIKGLKLANEIIPDIIISDVMMSKMDGLELCKQVKENMVTNHIPVILLTAKTDLKSRLEGLTLGADDYVSKPFNVSELLLRIKNRLELQKSQRETIFEELKLLPNYSEEKNNKEKSDPFLLQVEQILENNLSNEQFGVNDLASSLNMSRTSLHRKIKALTNMTTGKIIQVYKLKRASTLLKENYNIAEVSYKTGFGSPSYFSKCFKETYGLTPTEYLENKGLKQ
ncbi:hybrid sensor histidine kinase/response regulator transcription factor [Mangrovimonas sp. ST2L15]|uniref:hybrid sensor histidine kinase/response regulator transcription factor n=1 Tax=Mangrovimonas sp. ST2L15 TaxID=1645916 RepID=UPI0006B5CC06|nr:hybrid sensor histidine kinase/response regulator transcription factor [Mangrovimonas sp. ST2L15]